MKGLKLNDEEWITAIETPSMGLPVFISYWRIAVSCSVWPGDYRNYSRSMVFVTHEIDPRSGNPLHIGSQQLWLSVISCEADALATLYGSWSRGIEADNRGW